MRDYNLFHRLIALAILAFVGCGDQASNLDSTEIVIVRPADNAVLYGPDTIRVLATNADVVAKISILIDGTALGSALKHPYEIPLEASFWADGNTHTLIALANQNSSNEALSNLVTVRISEKAAVIPQIFISGDSTVLCENSSVLFSWTSINEADHYLLEIADEPLFLSPILSETTSDTSFSAQGLASRPYYYRVNAVHASGAIGKWSSVGNFRIWSTGIDSKYVEAVAPNPIHRGEYSWDQLSVIDPMVLDNPDGYKMWFAGWGGGQPTGIGYATSMDGVSWIEHDKPVLEIAPGAQSVERNNRWPFVMKDDTGYRMWYTVWYWSGQLRIYQATSADGLSWARSPSTPILEPGEAGAFDAGGVGSPTVIKKDGSYLMWYQGRDAVDSDRYNIGYATSQDGITWTKHASNPILTFESLGTTEIFSIENPTVLLSDRGTFQLLYTVRTPAGDWINWATSTDGINWMNSASNPIIPLAGLENWWISRAGRAAIIENNNGYELWFAGLDATRWSIGYGRLAIANCISQLVLSN